MGNIIFGKRFRFFLPVSRTRITTIGRCIGFLGVVKVYLFGLVAVSMIAMPIYLQVMGSDRPQANYNTCRWVFVCMWLSSKLWKDVVYKPIGRQNAINMQRNNIWMAPCESIT
jgi:hypothetical protein